MEIKLKRIAILMAGILLPAVYTADAQMPSQQFEGGPSSAETGLPSLNLKDEDIEIVRLRKELKKKENLRQLKQYNRLDSIESMQMENLKLQLKLERERLSLALKQLLNSNPYVYTIEYFGVIGNVVILQNGIAVKTPVVLPSKEELHVKGNVVMVGSYVILPNVTISEKKTDWLENVSTKEANQILQNSLQAGGIPSFPSPSFGGQGFGAPNLLPPPPPSTP